ncbi:hypothetical protein Tco_0733963 [Tanacetum coccineum]
MDVGGRRRGGAGLARQLKGTGVKVSRAPGRAGECARGGRHDWSGLAAGQGVSGGSKGSSGTGTGGTGGQGGRQGRRGKRAGKEGQAPSGRAGRVGIVRGGLWCGMEGVRPTVGSWNRSGARGSRDRRGAGRDEGARAGARRGGIFILAGTAGLEFNRRSGVTRADVRGEQHRADKARWTSPTGARGARRGGSTAARPMGEGGDVSRELEWRRGAATGGLLARRCSLRSMRRQRGSGAGAGQPGGERRSGDVRERGCRPRGLGSWGSKDGGWLGEWVAKGVLGGGELNKGQREERRTDGGAVARGGLDSGGKGRRGGMVVCRRGEAHSSGAVGGATRTRRAGRLEGKRTCLGSGGLAAAPVRVHAPELNEWGRTLSRSGSCIHGRRRVAGTEVGMPGGGGEGTLRRARAERVILRQRQSAAVAGGGGGQAVGGGGRDLGGRGIDGEKRWSALEGGRGRQTNEGAGRWTGEGAAQWSDAAGEGLGKGGREGVATGCGGGRGRERGRSRYIDEGQRSGKRGDVRLRWGVPIGGLAEGKRGGADKERGAGTTRGRCRRGGKKAEVAVGWDRIGGQRCCGERLSKDGASRTRGEGNGGDGAMGRGARRVGQNGGSDGRGGSGVVTEEVEGPFRQGGRGTPGRGGGGDGGKISVCGGGGEIPVEQFRLICRGEGCGKHAGRCEDARIEAELTVSRSNPGGSGVHGWSDLAVMYGEDPETWLTEVQQGRVRRGGSGVGDATMDGLRGGKVDFLFRLGRLGTPAGGGQGEGVRRLSGAGAEGDGIDARRGGAAGVLPRAAEQGTWGEPD